MAQYQSVLFVCSGNFYRSRLSEILFNHYATEADISWSADSRGLLERVRHEGLSPSAIRYLERKRLEGVEQYGRNPLTAVLKDLEKADLVIALNREEHEPMMKGRFGQAPSILEKRGKLRYWNVYDLPGSGGFLKGLFHSGPERSAQEEVSGTEHVDFAVQALVWELLRKAPAKQ
ncbi:MAG: hypothetical protein HYR88_16500 [Verrucomicrobia bacterium]|nr:hypothetical protein [Verrucomicrobiota bacterium]MBI3870244.1 hypothetical protein [Verrucomicrobiota bacterium]